MPPLRHRPHPRHPPPPLRHRPHPRHPPPPLRHRPHPRRPPPPLRHCRQLLLTCKRSMLMSSLEFIVWRTLL